MNQIDIPAIIKHLKSKTNIKAITWDRIYFWLPITDTQSWIYITLNILWEQQAIMDKGTLIEFRFIWNNENTTFAQLLTLKNLVSWELYSSKKLDDFICYNCYEENWFKNWYDDKNRKVIIQDYRFYFIT